MNSHSKALQAFGRKLSLLLMVRGALRWAALWFFAWGVVVLAARYGFAATNRWLFYGLLGSIPIALVAAWLERRRRIEPDRIRAAYDRVNRCGGIIMSAEADAEALDAWQKVLPQASLPAVRWKAGRTAGLFLLAIGFVAVTLFLPQRMTSMAATQPLEIGRLVAELQAEVEVLKEEKILEPEKAEQLRHQFNQLQNQASALDPNKTWEALDHLKENNAELARQAAEEIVEKMRSLTEAQTLGEALDMAREAGLDPSTATQAARDMASMLKNARLEDGLVKAQIPPELLAQLDQLSREDLEKLLNAIQFNKTGLGRVMTNLANLKLIDPKKLSQCQGAGQCPNPDALAAYLCQNTNGTSFCSAAISYCRGGVNRGRGDAPMTWKEESSEQGARFKEEALPPAQSYNDSSFVGVSRTAPELSGDDVSAGRGALAGSAGAGGAAHAQVILPRHKQAVQSYFDRQQ